MVGIDAQNAISREDRVLAQLQLLQLTTIDRAPAFRAVDFLRREVESR